MGTVAAEAMTAMCTTPAMIYSVMPAKGKTPAPDGVVAGAWAGIAFAGEAVPRPRKRWSMEGETEMLPQLVRAAAELRELTEQYNQS